MKKKTCMHSAPFGYKNPQWSRAVGYRIFTPPSTSLTAKGLRVFGVGWRGILPWA